MVLISYFSNLAYYFYIVFYTRFQIRQEHQKYQKLIETLYKMLPFLKTENGDDLIEYKFCGYFGWTDNNLGLIGKSKEDGIYNLISCGANGIINAFAGTEILLDLFENRDNPLIPLFCPLRDR